MSDKILPVRYRYTYAPGYRVVTANSAWLFPATNGMISIDLLIEQLDTPQETISEFDGEKWQNEHVVNEANSVVARREAQIGLFVNPTTARHIALLLLAKADEMEPLAQNTDKEDKQEADHNDAE